MEDRRAAHDQQQEMNRREHVAWLESMEAELESHRRSSARYSDSAQSSPDTDFAVGSARASDEDIPQELLYRSLSLAQDAETGSLATDEIVDDEPPVYRSLASSMTSNMTDDDDAMATWLAQPSPPRPPLLRRQQAFGNLYSQQCAQAWAGIRP